MNEEQKENIKSICMELNDINFIEFARQLITDRDDEIARFMLSWFDQLHTDVHKALDA